MHADVAKAKALCLRALIHTACLIRNHYNQQASHRRRSNGGTNIKLLQGQRARPIVLTSQELQRLHNLRVSPASGYKRFGRLSQADDCQTGNAHDEDQTSACEPDVPPAGIVMPVARDTGLER